MQFYILYFYTILVKFLAPTCAFPFCKIKASTLNLIKMQIFAEFEFRQVLFRHVSMLVELFILSFYIYKKTKMLKVFYTRAHYKLSLQLQLQKHFYLDYTSLKKLPFFGEEGKLYN